MHSKHHSRAKRRKGERGNVVAYTVLSALFMFLAVGLGVDLSHFYLAKTELQNAADAAALAGASALTLPHPERITTAVDRAVDTMNLNKYNFDNRTFAAVMDTTTQRNLVRFAVNLDGPYVSEDDAEGNPNIRFIRVTTPTVPVNMIFAVPFLGTTQNLNAKAISGLSKPGNTKYCPFPLSAVQCGPTNSACVFNSQFWGDCGDPPISGSSPPKPPIHTYTDGTPACDPTKQFCKGCTYTVRSAGSGGPAPGNLGILGCAGSGCDTVRDALKAYGEDCQCGLTSVGDSMAVQTGECSGPISDGLNVRFDRYQPGNGPMSYSSSFPPDTNVAQGVPSGNGANETWPGITFQQYQARNPFQAPANGHTGVPERRILVLPITYVEDWPNGSSGSVPARGFGAFFMRNQATGTNGDIRLEYTGQNVTGTTGVESGSANPSNIVTPVLYR